MSQERDERDQGILVIESDAALRRVMALGLRQRGFQVTEAGALGDAWERIATPPAAIVLDVGVGAGSEWMVVRSLRAHRHLARVPLVLLTWDCPIDAELPDRDGVRYVCLAKPFDARALYDAVESVVRPPAVTLAHANPPRVAGTARGAGSAPMAARDGDADDLAHPASERAPMAATSIWPMVTAAGATLLVVGFLIHPALVVTGIIVIIGAVVLWTTESVEPAPNG
ncbi:MAG TPA: hypothetical protein VF818_00320 [Ktedonobacterales bacterium]